MNGLGRRIAMLAGLAALATTPTITAATADVNPVCGQTITTDTTLTADLGPCSNNGLVIGASNITLDLGGHRLFGTAQAFDGAGVYLLGRTGVRVTNGAISAFDAGVVIEGGSGNTVTGITATGNIGLQTSAQSSKFGDGIAVESSSDNQILNNTVRDNGPFAGIGVYSLIDSDHLRSTSGPSQRNLIQGNQVLENNIGRNGFTGSTDNDGIRIENTFANGAPPVDASNQIIGNQVSDSGLDGIAIFARSTANVIRFNQVTHNGYFRSVSRRGDGIIVNNFSDRTVIENNLVAYNADSGIRVRGPLGTNAGALNNRIVGNTSYGNVALPTIPSSAFGPSFDLNDMNPACDNDVWFGNRYHTANPACTTTGGQQI